jgi:hypothetical protein
MATVLPSSINNLYNFSGVHFIRSVKPMGARGRKSMAELMVPAALAEVIRRPEAPDDLTVEQGDEWCAIVGAMPPDHFMRGNYPMLSQLCRHIVSSRRIAQLIEQVANEKVLDHHLLVRIDFSTRTFSPLSLRSQHFTVRTLVGSASSFLWSSKRETMRSRLIINGSELGLG